MVNRYSTIRHKQFVLIILLCMVVLGVFLFFVRGVLHSGEERLKLSVGNKNAKCDVYLKSNGDIVTISESPSMKLIGEQQNLFISDQLILYKNTWDTLFVVWFTSIPTKKMPKKITDKIKYIHEDGYDPELISNYRSIGYKVFPSNVYP